MENKCLIALSNINDDDFILKSLKYCESNNFEAIFIHVYENLIYYQDINGIIDYSLDKRLKEDNKDKFFTKIKSKKKVWKEGCIVTNIVKESSNDYNLLILKNSKKSFLNKILNGSNLSKIINNSKINILILR